MSSIRRLACPFFMLAGTTHFAIPAGKRALWARLPFQAAFISWVLATMRGPD